MKAKKTYSQAKANPAKSNRFLKNILVKNDAKNDEYDKATQNQMDKLEALDLEWKKMRDEMDENEKYEIALIHQKYMDKRYDYYVKYSKKRDAILKAIAMT